MKISILGGGIGGLSTAIFLQKAGFDVVIYERFSSFSGIRAGIACWPNATFILEQLGVLGEVERLSGSVKAMNRYSNDGGKLGSLDINYVNSLMGYPSYSILRKDLLSVLSNALHDLNVPIYYDHKVVDVITNSAGKVSVIFGNGNQVHTKDDDIVIGADGRMNSLSRRFVHGSNSPIFQGFVNWIGVFESDENVFDDICVSDYWGIGERFGIVPVSNKKAYWAGGSVSSPIKEIQPENYKSELMAHFEHWPAPISDIIQSTPLDRINKIYVHDYDPITTWYKKNLVLLGDAAHSPLPTSGQGACQALEDAWHLTNCLMLQSSSDAAFERFTELRYAKTTSIIMGGRQLAASIFNANSGFCHQRNENSKQTDYQNVAVGMAKGWSSGLPL